LSDNLAGFADLLRLGDLDAMLAELPAVLPWAQYLPAPDRLEFLRELIQATEDGDTAGMLQSLTDWQQTAELYADTTVVTILTEDTE
jgi:hypothetical protein